MDSLAAALDEVDGVLRGTVARVFGSRELRGLGDDELLVLAGRAAAVSRLVEALLVGVVGLVVERVDAAPHAERISTTHGCRSVKELVQRVTRQSSRAVGDLVRVARAVTEPVAPTSGQALPAVYPAMRDALADGAVGIDAVTAVTSVLDGAGCAPEGRRAAEAELAAAARGVGCDGAPAACADELRMQAQVWALFLDQDGAEPREARALRRRGLSLGVCRDGLVPVRGNLLPEVAGQLLTLFHAILNPKGVESDGSHLLHRTAASPVPAAPAEWADPSGPARAGLTGPRFVATARQDPAAPAAAEADSRTRVQRQHDALATILSVAARSAQVPTIGGAAPTLVVSVTAGDLAAGSGHAHLDGCDEPLPLAVARQVACSGAIQRVTTDRGGRIRAIHTTDRVFGPHQRRAITLRDGNCIIPGCHVPAAWCEIHHVHEHSRGGPTHTDNGVLLCWHHHRTLDLSGWSIRMRHGIPEVRGPTWWDPAPRWRPVTTSPTRLRQRLAARQSQIVPEPEAPRRPQRAGPGP